MALTAAPGPSAPSLQRKMTVSAPTDDSEREADEAADQVMRMPADGPAVALGANGEDDALQRKCASCDEESPLQRRAAPGAATQAAAAPAPGLDVAGAMSAARSGGEPMAPSDRAFFEPRFGHDFGRVRVHADGAAASAAKGVQARAYTVGQHIVFGVGEYRPGSDAGRHLMAHELSHVVQQRGSKR